MVLRARSRPEDLVRRPIKFLTEVLNAGLLLMYSDNRIFAVLNVEISRGELGRRAGSRGSRSSESDSDEEEVLIV